MSSGYPLDSADNVVGTIMANTSSTGARTLTSEFEIMNADPIRILYDATKDNNVEHNFGKSVERYDQDGTQAVTHFSDGSSDTDDVLVGVYGQGSRVRKGILTATSTPIALRERSQLPGWCPVSRRTSALLQHIVLQSCGPLHNAAEPQTQKHKSIYTWGDSKELSSCT